MEDPLGIGGEDSRKTKHQQEEYDSDEDEEGSTTAAELLSPRKAKRIAARKLKGALDPTDEKFDAIMYLVKVHLNTSIEDLQTGKGRLEQKVTSRQRQLEFLVKDNFARFMICKDAVDDIYMTISGQKLNNSAKIVDQASSAFKDLLSRSKNVFSPLLERQIEIDRIKSVLGILKRSQFIFNLPRRMRDNIAAGEYSKVVLNYKKVRSLVATASHASIKNVVSEVDSIVRDLHTTLFEVLDGQNVSLKQQEETIRLLVDLGSPVDPAWYSLEIRHARMKAILQERVMKANSVTENAHYSLGLSSQKNLSSLILTVSSMLQEHMPPYLQLANNFFDRTYHKSLSEKKKNALSEQHTEAEFISKLHELLAIYTDIVIRAFYGPTVRSAADAVQVDTRSGLSSLPLNAQLAPKANSPSTSTPTTDSAKDSATQTSSSGSMIVTSRKRKTTQSRNRGASLSARHSSSELRRASSVTSKGNTPTLHRDASLGASLPNPSMNTSASADSVTASGGQAPSPTNATPPTPSRNNAPGSVVADEPEQDKDKVMAILKLAQLLHSIAPAHYLEPLDELLDLVTRTFVREIFADVLADARTWYAQEDWIVLDQQRVITALPFFLESTLQSTFDRLEGLIAFDNPLSVYVQKRVMEVIETFADNIHHLAFVDSGGNANLPQDLDDEGQNEMGPRGVDQPLMSPDSRLLIVLNNCTFTKKNVLPAVLETFHEQFGVDLYSQQQRTGIQLLEQLEDMILRRYIRHKTATLNEITRSGLLFSGFDWAGIRAAPTGIRDYIMSCLLELVFIHDELHRVSRLLVRPVLNTVVENILQCFIDCLQYIDSISNHGVLQIGMELEMFASIMRKYRTPIATVLSNELDHILQYNNIMDPKSDEVLAKDKKVVKGLISTKIGEAALLVECFTGRDADDLKA